MPEVRFSPAAPSTSHFLAVHALAALHRSGFDKSLSRKPTTTDRFRIHRRGETAMMMDWNQYHKEIGARLGELMKLSPDTVRGYQMLSAAGPRTNHLNEKSRRLISLAVAVTTHCDGCIVVHTDAALKAGAKEEEITEALGVAVSMNAGAALVYSTRVLDAVDAKSAAAQGA